MADTNSIPADTVQGAFVDGTQVTTSADDTEVSTETEAYDFAAFVEDLDEADVTLDAPEATPADATVAETVPPVVAPVTEPVQQAPTEPVQPAPVEPAAAPTQEPSTGDPAQVQQQMAEFIRNSAQLLAEQTYALDPATAELVDKQKPSQIIPVLAGRIHMQVMTATMNQVANMFPTLLKMHTENNTEIQQTENAFYTEFPALKGNEEVVNRIARAYVAQNPKAKKENAFKEIGTMAMITLKIPLTGAPQPAPAPVQKPFMPVSAMGASMPSAPSGEGSWIDTLIEED